MERSLSGHSFEPDAMSEYSATIQWNREQDAAANESGKMAMTRVTLRPHVTFCETAKPAAAEFAAMHHEAHAECYIANSVTTKVVCEPLMS